MSKQGRSPRVFEALRPDLPPSRADDEFAEWFIEIAGLIEGCRRFGKVSLLLSTCRNEWMTVNAVFYDVKKVIAPTALRDPATEALVQLELMEFDRADRAARVGLRALAQALEKVEVWRERASLIKEFEEQIAGLPSLDQRKVQRWYEGQRLGRTLGTQQHQAKYMALSLESHDEAAASLALLLDVVQRLRLCLNIVTHSVRLLGGQPAAATTADLTLFEAESNQSGDGPDEMHTDEETWMNLLAMLASGADRLRATWKPSAKDGGTLGFADGNDITFGSGLPAISVLRGLMSDLRERAAVTIEHVRVELKENFRPNVAEKPLPDPYLLDLRTSHAQRGRVGRTFDVETYKGTTESLSKVTRIALLECGMPESAYSHDDPDLYVYDRARKEGALRAREIALAAIEASAAGNAQLLVLPEVFIPRASVPEVFTTAKDHNIALIAGLEYENVSGRAVNEVAIVAQGIGDVVNQRKQLPSVYEARGSLFDSDGRLTIVRDTPLGVFATVVCSDYLELDVLWALASHPDRIDVLIVTSRNPNPDVFARLAQADAARLHAYVVIVNAFSPRGETSLPSGRGTIVAQPHSQNPLVDLEHVTLPVVWDQIEQPAVAFAELKITELRKLDTERPSRAFLRPPNFPRRG